MRIAFIANPELPGGWYRGIGPMIALAARGSRDRASCGSPRKGILGELVAGCDLLHIHRAHEAEVLEIVRHAKRARIAVVYDNDDDMRAIPRGNAAHKDYGGFAGDRAQREIRRLLQQAELAIAASLPIAERFREYGAEHVRADRELRARQGAGGERAAERRRVGRRLAGRQRAPSRRRADAAARASSDARSTRTHS